MSGYPSTSRSRCTGSRKKSLQNIVKHANASVARLRFALDDDTARLEIVDNGIGFDTFENPLGSDEMGGYGVLSMAERAELVGGRLEYPVAAQLRDGRHRHDTAALKRPSTRNPRRCAAASRSRTPALATRWPDIPISQNT